MSFITVTGVLTNPSGAVLPNYNILFEAIRTSDTVINNTDVLIVTNSSGGYSFELGYGTYTLKIKSGREARYSTVASNILIYSQALDNNSIQQIILAQDGLADINIELIDQFLQIRADVLLNAQNASTSETNAAASAASALTSKNAAAASATSASSSATTATTKASEAAASATSASSSAATATTKATEAAASATTATTKATSATASATSASSSAATATTKASEAATSATTATTKATEAAASATSALASKNAAATSETNAASSASSALASKNAAATSETNAASAAASASTSATSALASKNAAATSETNAAASAAAASTSEQQAAIYAASLAGGIVENGGVDLSSGVAPTPRPDGLGGYISTLWKVTVGGTVNAVNYAVGDSIVYSKALGSYYKIDSTDQVSSVNGMSGAVTVTTITGNAGTATKLATARSISTSGDITWSVSFDGSANVTAAATLATVATPGTYNSVTVDAKGRVISGTNPSILATEEEVVARIEATKAVTPATLNAVVPYSPNINPTLDLDFANQVYRHFEGPDGLVSHPLTPFVTFTRSSIATFFDAMGVMRQAAVDTPRIDYDPVTGECKGLLVEEQRTNLLLNTSHLKNWVGSAGQNLTTAPDGSLTGVLLYSIAPNNLYSIYSPAASATNYTFSVYTKQEKSATLTWGFEAPSLGADKLSTYTYATKTATSPSNTTVKVTELAGGWVRLSMTVTTTAAGSLVVHIGSTGSYVWRPMLEQGAFATSLITSSATFTGRASTATYLDANGVVQTAASGVARSNAYDYDSDGVLRPIGLLLEDSATNQLLYSEQFDNAAWNKYTGSITANAATAPDGTATADLFTSSGTVQSRIEYVAALPTSDTVYTFSFYAKKGSNNYVSAAHYSGSTNNYVIFDIANGAIVNQSAGVTSRITKVGSSWYRCSMTITVSASPTNNLFKIVQTDGVTYSTSETGGYFYAWGAQLEVGNYATSYIKTTSAQVTRAADTSTSAQATRAADNAVISGANFSQWYKQYEGAVTCEFDINALGGALWPGLFSFYADNTHRFGSYIDDNSSDGTQFIIKNGAINAVAQINASAIAVKTKQKVASSFSSTSVPSYEQNGVAGVIATSGVGIPLSISQLKIGFFDSNLNGHIRSLKYYPKALTATELQAMTA